MSGQISRVCLKCQKPFNSKGIGNRICPKCSAINAKDYRYDVQEKPRSRKTLDQQ